MIGCLQTRVRKQPIIALYFESENELKFYNHEARPRGYKTRVRKEPISALYFESENEFKFYNQEVRPLGY